LDRRLSMPRIKLNPRHIRRKRSRPPKHHPSLTIHSERQGRELARRGTVLRPTPRRSKLTHILPSLSPRFSERVQSEDNSAGRGVLAPKQATTPARPINILVPPLQRPKVQFGAEPFLANSNPITVHLDHIISHWHLTYTCRPRTGD